MIVVVGATGVTGWIVKHRLGVDRRYICLNDQFTVTDNVTAPRNPRQLLVAILQHSEQLNGATRSVAQLDELT